MVTLAFTYDREEHFVTKSSSSVRVFRNGCRLFH